MAAGCISGSIVLLDLRGLEAWRVALRLRPDAAPVAMPVVVGSRIGAVARGCRKRAAGYGVHFWATNEGPLAREASGGDGRRVGTSELSGGSSRPEVDIGGERPNSAESVARNADRRSAIGFLWHPSPLSPTGTQHVDKARSLSLVRGTGFRPDPRSGLPSAAPCRWTFRLGSVEGRGRPWRGDVGQGMA